MIGAGLVSASYRRKVAWLPLFGLMAFYPALANAPEPAAATPVFDPEAFFEGRTEGNGTLKIVLRKAEKLHVRSRGHTDADGTLVLDQVVERPNDPPERRQWRFRKLGPGRYTGTLSVAEGPVAVALSGNRLHLKYKLEKGNVSVEQWIYLQPGGRTAHNRMTMHKFGLKFGSMDEIIRKVD